jgi:hypothetical protein
LDQKKFEDILEKEQVLETEYNVDEDEEENEEEFEDNSDMRGDLESVTD